MDQRKPTALLVEDDPDLRKLVRTYIESAGLLVIEAADGSSSLKRMAEVVPDLVCLDLVLPDLSGYEVCEFIRRSPELRDVPVLVMSGRSLPEDRATAVEMGASAYLIKPFSRGEFTNQVDMLLRSSAARLISSRVGFRRRVPRVLPEPRAETRSFGAQQVRNYVGYAVGALGRHKLLAALAFALVALGTVGSVLVLPKEYYVETRIWAWRNQPTQALGTASPIPADAPTHAASETILRRDNLVALVKQTELMSNWSLSHFPVLWLKDRLISIVRSRTTEEDKLNALVAVLEKQLWAKAGESTVTIGILWPDATMAQRVVEAAQQDFLEARYGSEIADLAEKISILEGHANSARESVEASLNEIRSAREGNETGPSERVQPQTSLDPPNPDLAQLKVMLIAKRRQIKEIQDFRQRRLAEFQEQLVEQQTRYASSHPVLANLRQRIRALSQDSARLASMKQEEQELFAEYRKRGGDIATLAGDETLKPLDNINETREMSPGDDNRSVNYARARLNVALVKYDRLVEAIDRAKVELDTARSGFKQRYAVILPPNEPSKPVMPKGALAAGFIAALLIAIIAAVGADLRGGRLLEQWQVENLLALPVLATVRGL